MYALLLSVLLGNSLPVKYRWSKISTNKQNVSEKQKTKLNYKGNCIHTKQCVLTSKELFILVQ